MTSTLTIRIDPALKAALELVAADADQTVTEYVVRAVKLRMAQRIEVTHTLKLRRGQALTDAELDALKRGAVETVSQRTGTTTRRRRAQKGPLST